MNASILLEIYIYLVLFLLVRKSIVGCLDHSDRYYENTHDVHVAQIQAI